MRITCTQENLHRALQIVGRVVGNRVALPVLGNVLLQTEEGRLKVSATDLEIGLTTWIGAKVDEEGAITVPAKAFAEFIASVSDPTFSLKVEEGVLAVQSDHAKARFLGIDAEEFPIIPTVASKPTLSVITPAFLQAMKQAVIATAVDESRPVLAGVLLRWEGKEMKCVATDSYRLAEKKIKLESAVPEKADIIVPQRSVNELIRVLSGSEADAVSVSVHENQILFSFNDVEFVSRLIDGKYPDYEKIIPKEIITSITVDSETLRGVLRSVSIFARESANMVKFKFQAPKTVAIMATSSTLGNSSFDLDTPVEGSDLEVSFNVKFLQDALTAITDTTVKFSLAGQFQAASIVGEETTDYRYIIMPLKSS